MPHEPANDDSNGQPSRPHGYAIRLNGPRRPLRARRQLASTRCGSKIVVFARAARRIVVARSRRSEQDPEEGRAGPPSEFRSGRYEVVSRIGQGAMGVVFKARHKLLNCFVAIKVLSDRLIRDPDAMERFKHEARIVLDLSHSHIVKLHSVELEDVWMYMVMEYLDGGNLRDYVEGLGPLPVEEVLLIAESCALALDHAHRHGILHGDLKPENLVVTADGVVKVVDFGAALWAADQKADELAVVEGTPAYMSPEQARGETLDARTDVYSLGMVCFELLCGRPAIPLNTRFEDVADTPPNMEADLPTPLLAVLKRATAIEREERYESAAAFQQGLAKAVQALR